MNSWVRHRSADERVLRAATWRLAAVTAAAVTLALLVVGALVLAVVVRDQRAQSAAALREAVSDTDDVEAQPAGVLVWVRGVEDRERASSHAPDWFPLQTAVAAVSASAPRDDRVVTVDGQTYKVRTVWKGQSGTGGSVVQAAYGTAAQRAERDRLVQAILVAEVVGFVLSLLLGLLLARRAIRPLAAAFDRQRRFVADASHELRTPLTLMSTRAQVLERTLRGSTASQLHDQSLALVADTRRMNDVVDDLLMSATLSAEPTNRTRVDVRSIADEAVDAAGAHAAELGVSLAGPMGTHEGRADVLGSSGPLRRVVDALLDNALSHTPAGGVVTVDVQAGDRVVLRVSDTGPGIDPEVEPRLFHRFAHGDSRAGRRGFGLGLSLVREIVEAHGGEVSGANDSAGGASFVVSLPCAPEGPASQMDRPRTAVESERDGIS